MGRGISHGLSDAATARKLVSARFAYINSEFLIRRPNVKGLAV
jgi:hypothetical protein